MYMTTQRRLLLHFFNSNPDHSFSAQEIHQSLSHEGEAPISISAVYRNLSDLSEAGLIVKITTSESQEIRYRYVDSINCRDKLHMTCNRCGHTFHADTHASSAFLEAIRQADGFCIDPARTMIYGLCPECNKKSSS